MENKKKKVPASDFGIWPRPNWGGAPMGSFTDPQGMYTGLPRDPYEVPVQDADDL